MSTEEVPKPVEPRVIRNLHESFSIPCCIDCPYGGFDGARLWHCTKYNNTCTEEEACGFPAFCKLPTVSEHEKAQAQDIMERLVELLNEVLTLDKAAMENLVLFRARCSVAIADHPHLVAGEAYGGYSLGLIGLLNGLSSDRKIAAVFEEDGNPGIARFILLEADLPPNT